MHLFVIEMYRVDMGECQRATKLGFIWMAAKCFCYFFDFATKIKFVLCEKNNMVFLFAGLGGIGVN
ncbi:MAG: hypothetical protein EA394_06295 [Bacteroidia bacterium]|nr:MAG: hypothetical protein EA394_06295 [Bacteroidia bacterium]